VLIPRVQPTASIDLRDESPPGTVRDTGSVPATRATRWLRALRETFTALLVLATALSALTALRGIVMPGDWTYSDGVPVYHALRVRDGLPLYPDISESPFIALIYTPLHVAAAGWLARLASLDVAGTMYVVRGLAVLGALVASVCIAVLARRCGTQRRGALVAAGLFATSYVLHPWAYTARPDLPALSLVLLGFVALTRSRSWKAALVAGLLMGAGFACKQTFVVGVAAATLALLWRRDLGRVCALVAGWLSFVGVTLLAAEIASDGRFFTQTISSNIMPWRSDGSLGHLIVFVALAISIVALAAYGWRWHPTSRSTAALLHLYAILVSAYGVATLARIGSNYNYLVEASAALAVFAGLGFDRCASVLRDRTPGTRTVPAHRRDLRVALVAMGLATFGLGYPLLFIWQMGTNPPDRSNLIAVLRQAPGPVLTERDAMAVLLAGKEPIGGDPYGDGIYAEAGRWDPEHLNSLIRSQAFALIALDRPVEQTHYLDDQPWWPPHALEEIRRHYTFSRRLDTQYLYVPNP
jgi:hypothetical protein